VDAAMALEAEEKGVADDMVVLFEYGSWLSASFEATMSDTDAEQQWQYHMPPSIEENGDDIQY
jgi:hypothetical protein